MAYDPIQEDCLRLILGALHREHIYPLENAAFIARCMEDYHRDPAKLIASDADRSFHLVALATETIDYRLPFVANDTEADRLSIAAEAQLREACQLDPKNWDAQRMLAALSSPSNDEYVSYLLEHRAEVEETIRQDERTARDPYSQEYMRDLGKRGLVRWLAALASRALISGRYRLSLSAAEDCLALAADDPADVRYTAMLALAKLECTRQDLKRFRLGHPASYRAHAGGRRRHHLAEKSADAWELIAELAIAYHELDFSGATRVLRTILSSYDSAAETLYFQEEFPDGLFGRVNVSPGSDDELILALSEATPLLQEGVGAPENAGLAVWIASHDLVTAALERTSMQAGARRGIDSLGGN